MTNGSIRHGSGRIRAWALGGLALALGCGTAGFAAEGFSRYQVILDRQPFGAPPPAPAAPDVPPPAFAQALRISALIEDDQGHVRVGFYNQQTRRSFFLGVGDREDGLEVVSVSIDRGEAVLRQAGETVVLPMQSGPAATPTPTAPSRPTVRPGRGMPAVTGDDARRRMMEERRREYLERRAQRQQEGAEEREEPVVLPPRRRVTGVEQQPDGTTRRLRGEELRQHLQEYQMEVIRQGLPPLPIPLTPEMDARLVEEGILPP